MIPAEQIPQTISPCPNKETCGSCPWSSLPYELQLERKLAEINQCFRDFDLRFKCEEIRPSPKTSRYRNRMDFVIDFEGRVGLREKGKWWKVIDNHQCFLGSEAIAAAFPVIRDWVRSSGLSYFDRKKYTGCLRYAVLRSNLKNEILITILTSSPSSTSEEFQIRKTLEELDDSLEPTSLVWSINNTTSDISLGTDLRTLSGSGFLYETIAGLTYRISPNAFFQTNSPAAGILQDTVRELICEPGAGTLLDLYCGTGFFSLGLARHFQRTIGVEISEEAIKDARENAILNQLAVEYYAAPTEAFEWEAFATDVVIVDPPRSGLHPKALTRLLRAKPNKLVYVSCNFKNFAKELKTLQEHYQVEQMRAVDMFPHTPHVELVTLFKKK